ncbi:MULTISPECIES: spore cortex biosynthesis protein YabQ [Bacillaceae]|uniref:Spore cortex biosynthesis protein YabQ n=1 Tax=Evansella alkalicola TaxID=745819 RepID=A0ABS6JTU4_9BACI|nr:spore cortex biosynthesis protein YabQ [Litchfieldia alkalitelluris]MBU9722004.1 spore cortex biosynthesis protein YabQ [Bacillus alkalicola]
MTLDVQFLSILASTGMGIVLGAAFDTYRRFVKSPKRLRWSLIINDILFWILQALLFFYVLLQVNNGEVRFYLLLAILLGYSIYRALLERIYRRVLEVMIQFVSNMINILIRTIKVLVYEPLKWLLKLIVSLSMIVLTTIWGILHFLIRIILSPFRWIGQKYVKSYGIPFQSTINKVKSFVGKVNTKFKKLFHWFRRK